MGYVQLSNLYKKYENADSFSSVDINLEINKGEFIAFVGPSGCGKSTLLRMIAGLEEITGGTISIDGVVVNDVHPKDRDIAMVFQNYALYPHMTVRKNIEYSLKIKKKPKDIREERVKWASDILGLDDYLDRKPKDLSGGQRQRVALGRAIVRHPKVFLMDEPLSNLDAKLRVSMRNEIIKLHKRLKTTTIYVTHDQVEAMTMADRIVILKGGIIQQVGAPMELYNNPMNKFVAGFIGSPQMNFMDVEINNKEIILPNKVKLEIPEGISKKIGQIKGNYTLGIRPEHFHIDNIELNSQIENKIKLKIEDIENLGHENYVTLNMNGENIVVKTRGDLDKKIGDLLEVGFNMNKIFVFNEKEESLNFEK